MIAIAKPSQTSTPAWQTKFTDELLPGIITHARFSFRSLMPEARDEAIQAVVCHCCAAVARLAELGKLDIAYPYPLAQYAVAQVRAGRILGQTMNCHDVSSEYCRITKGIVLERLDKFDETEECWREAFVPDQTCTPADLAASRMDFAAWLKTLKPRDRRIVRYLGAGNRTKDAAQKFSLSKSRISLLRQELRQSWHDFCGESQAIE